MLFLFILFKQVLSIIENDAIYSNKIEKSNNILGVEEKRKMNYI